MNKIKVLMSIFAIFSRSLTLSPPNNDAPFSVNCKYIQGLPTTEAI
jgi:hypothetical protein